MKKAIIFLTLTILCSHDLSAQAWAPVQNTVLASRRDSDNFGLYISMDGDYAILSAHGHNYDSDNQTYVLHAGTAYIYRRLAGVGWQDQQKLVASDRGVGDEFGTSLAIYGE
jgi:hypothetical protein